MLLTSSRPLVPPVALGGPRQGLCVLLHAVGTEPLDGGPGFRQKAAFRPRVMAQQRPHEPAPALAQNAGEPPPWRAPWPPVSWTVRVHVGQRPFSQGSVGDSPNTHDPQRGDRYRPPQACRPCWIGHPGAVPLPPRTFGELA